jgi:hypothetical protein
MQPIPLPLQKEFEKYLKNKEVSDKFKGEYKKWLQYYLDFCWKYNFSPADQGSLPPFIRKLEQKRQTQAQRERAFNSINLYYQIVKAKATSNQLCPVRFLQMLNGKVVKKFMVVAFFA